MSRVSKGSAAEDFDANRLVWRIVRTFDYSADMAAAVHARATTSLAELAERGVLSGVVARERTLAVLPAFESLLPNASLQRGSVVACTGSGAVSLALALAAGPSQQGAWVAVAGFPDIGVSSRCRVGRGVGAVGDGVPNLPLGGGRVQRCDMGRCVGRDDRWLRCVVARARNSATCEQQQPDDWWRVPKREVPSSSPLGPTPRSRATCSSM